MGNRYVDPFVQLLDSSGDLLNGGTLTFYVTGTSTLTDVYTNSTLTTAASNPQTLDAYGRPTQELFLDPTVTYKVVLKDADGAIIATRDPVVDHAANVSAAFTVYNGNPNGNVAGNAGSVGGAGASVIWDISNNLLWVCTTTGAASAAVWTNVASVLSGAVVETGVVSPSSIGASQNDYEPAGIGSASMLRLTSSAAYNITGIAAQTAGTKLVLVNIGSFALTVKDESGSSTAANRFALPGDIVLHPDSGCIIQYDGTSSRWRAISEPRTLEYIVVAAGDETTAITAGTAKVKWRNPFLFTVTEVRASLSTAQATNGAGGTFTVDINESGTTILSTKITIDNTETTTATAAAAAVVSDASLAADAEMSVDVDQIGDGTAKGLKVTIIGFRN